MGGGTPNDSESIVEGEGASPGKGEENFATDMFLTSTGSNESNGRAQPLISRDFLFGTAVEPSSTLSSTSASTTSTAGQDRIRAIRNASSTKNAKKLKPNSVDGLEIAKSSDLLNVKCETSSVVQDREPNFDIEGYPENKLEPRNHEPLVAVNESAVFAKTSNLRNELGIEHMRDKIRRYKPGDGLLEVGGVGRMGFDVPKTTTLLLVGHSGAGKSTLINNLVRVLEKRTTGFDRAQVYEQKGDGSLFLQEYVFFEGAKQFSVFDSRGFSEKTTVGDLALVRRWMTEGICHGEPVCRPSDSQITKEELEGRGRQEHAHLSTKRRVDFVIFVLNAVTVHDMLEPYDTAALDNLVMLFKSPFLSFKDDRPVVVMTHGDKLSPINRISTRICVGKFFGVSPYDQVFDVSCLTARTVNPGDEDPVNDLALLNMLDFALQRADRNLPYKNSVSSWLEKAYVGIMCRWNELDQFPKTVLMGILVSWLFCLVLFLAAKGVAHHRRPWSLHDILAENILGKSHRKKFSLKNLKKRSWQQNGRFA